MYNRSGSTIHLPSIIDTVEFLLRIYNQFDDDEVRRLLALMPAKSSPMEKVPTSILKSCSVVFAPIIARLANLSFAEGVVSSFQLAASRHYSRS